MVDLENLADQFQFSLLVRRFKFKLAQFRDVAYANHDFFDGSKDIADWRPGQVKTFHPAISYRFGEFTDQQVRIHLVVHQVFANAGGEGRVNLRQGVGANAAPAKNQAQCRLAGEFILLEDLFEES